MFMDAKSRVLVLGGNFASLTAARFIREYSGDAVDITVLDRKPYLIFIPNIAIEVLANRDPSRTMHMDIVSHLDHDGSHFLEGEIQEINLENKHVTFAPNERPGAASEKIGYDYLVIALGARLAYDKIEGFGQYGHTVSDSYYGNKLRRYLFGGGYKGGPIVIGSARFQQGTKGNPDWLPISGAACDGPPLEVGLSLATWLREHKLDGPKNITLFSPANIIAEDAGEAIVKSFLEMAGQMGFHYEKGTPDIRRVTAEGIEFSNGKSLEAELKIIFPNWEPHPFVKALPIADEAGFIITDLMMRNARYPNVFALGDCAALTVPKLGAHGHQQAKIAAAQIAKDLGKMPAEKADKQFWPEIVCFGDMGGHKAFYIHSDVWYGGKTSVFKMGYTFYAMKMAFKEMYFATGGKVPTWGMSLTELFAEKII
jgi:sulfide:quinone oxidoreductase